MDPNETLRIIRESIATLRPGIEAGDWDEDLKYDMGEDAKEAIEALVEHVDALDEWLAKGGFLPRDWMDRRR